MRRTSLDLQVEVPDASEDGLGKHRRPGSTRLARQLSSPYAAPLLTPATQLGNQLKGLNIPLTRTRSGSGSSPRPEAAVASTPSVPQGAAAEAKKQARAAARKKRPPAAKPADKGVDKKRAAVPPPPVLSTALSLSVPKTQQEDSWDCGLACARMVLLAMGCASTDCTLARLRSRLASSEVWSIDLAYLLSDFGVAPCEYLTSSLNLPSPSRRRCPFYASTLSEDLARVACLMSHAEAQGVRLRHASLSAAELWNTLRDDDHLAIALVDPRVLYDGWDEEEAAAEEEQPPSPESRAFFGHYVLLCGLDDAADAIVLKDPARGEEATLVKAARLERARKAKGTDEDLIVVPLFDQEHEPCAPPAGVEAKIRAVLSAAHIESPVLG